MTPPGVVIAPWWRIQQVELLEDQARYSRKHGIGWFWPDDPDEIRWEPPRGQRW